jgi:hypothetical protein
MGNFKKLVISLAVLPIAIASRGQKLLVSAVPAKHTPPDTTFRASDYTVLVFAALQHALDGYTTAKGVSIPGLQEGILPKAFVTSDTRIGLFEAASLGFQGTLQYVGVKTRHRKAVTIVNVVFTSVGFGIVARNAHLINDQLARNSPLKRY